MDLQKKYDKLKDYLGSFGSAAVAFSGGVDSVLLLNAAIDALGNGNVIAVTASLFSVPEREIKEAVSFCKDNNIKQILLKIDEFDIEGFGSNPKNRCYLCKKAIFNKIIAAADENGISTVVEGSNADDGKDYRPGMAAIEELGVKSPLKAVGLGKEEIRKLSKEFGLPTWDKPSFACLATRFVYGETINKERLLMVDKAEQFLFDMGFRQVRVRVHGQEKGTIARIELLPEEISKLTDKEKREKIYNYFKEIGFSYAALDLAGYRTGSMNETL